MNFVRKIFILSLLLTPVLPVLASTPQTAENFIATTVQRIQNMPTSMIDLPTSDFLWAGGFALLGAAIGHICTSAFVQLLDPEMKPVPRFFQPHKWGKGQSFGTVGGAAALGYLSLAYSGPKARAACINQPLLIAVVGTQHDTLKIALDDLYVSHRFPRAAAFRDLDILRITLAAILESFTKLKGKIGYSEAKQLTPDLLAFAQAVKEAMLLLKKDPQWLNECNAATLAMTQANIQGCQNAQLAGTVIQLAHR